MNSFITLENTNSNIEYFYTKQHFIILFISLVIIVFFSMYATRQRFKFQRIFVLVSMIFLVLLEVGRLVWRYFYLQHNNESLSFLNITNLNFFTLSLYICIVLILLASLTKKDKKHKSFGLAFVFSVSSIIAITNLIYPSFLNTNFEFYHLYNLVSVLLRAITIMLGFFFIFSKWINTNRFLDLWKWFLSLVIFGIICIVIYFALGQPNNLFYLEYVPAFESLGIYLNFPLQFILIGIFVFALQFLFFIPFYVYKKIKNKD